MCDPGEEIENRIGWKQQINGVSEDGRYRLDDGFEVYTRNQKPEGRLSALTALKSLNNGPRVSDFRGNPASNQLIPW